VYRTTFWVAATLVLFMAMVQLGVAAFRRDGQSLARVAVGTAQFLMVWVAWITYAVLVLAACGGLTRAVMKATMGVDAWSQWQPWEAFSTKDIGDAAIATVLGCHGPVPGVRRDRAPARHAHPRRRPGGARRDHPDRRRRAGLRRRAGPGSGSRCAGSTPPRSPRC
jgi:hypothetical protein